MCAGMVITLLREKLGPYRSLVLGKANGQTTGLYILIDFRLKFSHIKYSIFTRCSVIKTVPMHLGK